jgi:hypothetical protein
MKATRFTETWNYNGYFGVARDIELKPGVMNENARDVFGRGHCHSLALALYELLPDAELMGVWSDCRLEHVFVRLPDGAMLDASGLTYDEDRISYGLPDADVSELDIGELDWVQESGHFRRARPDDAKSFARTLIARAAARRETAMAA